MKAIDAIRFALESSRGLAMTLISDMQDAPLTQPTPRGGNHPLWVLGHLTYSDGMLLDIFLLGKENRFADLAEMFSAGTEPTANGGDYPPMERLIEMNEVIRAAVLEHLGSLRDEDLELPSHAPAEMADYFGTTIKVFTAMSVHYSFHAGQVADARRVLQRKPLIA